MEHESISDFTRKILVDLKGSTPTNEAIASYLFHEEHTDDFELTQQVTDAVLVLWRDGYIVANVTRVDPADATSAYLRPTDIQLTDKGLHTVSADH